MSIENLVKNIIKYSANYVQSCSRLYPEHLTVIYEIDVYDFGKI